MVESRPPDDGAPGSPAPAWTAFGAVGAIALVRLALFLSASADQQIGLIPDDAFYYFLPARNFAQLGVWTFDGRAPDTGLHLLYAYSLAGLFWLVPQITDAALYAIVAGAATLLLAGAAALVARAAARDFGAAGVLGVIVVFCAPAALRQQTFFVESCPLIFLSSALLAFLSRAATLPKPAVLGLATPFALGFLANLARSDFGLLPVACALACCGLRRDSRGTRVQAQLAAVATLGAALGVAAITLHTLGTSGTWIQSSARMKLRWGLLLGYDPFAYLRWLLALVAPPGSSWLGARGLGLAVLGAGAIGAWLRLGGSALRVDRWPLAVGAALAVAGYAVFYGITSAGVPPWYLASALAPLAYLAGGLTNFIPFRMRQPCAALVAVWAVVNLRTSLEPFVPYQVAMRNAGIYLRLHPEIEIPAAWNAGIVAWFARRPVINLDGLANDEIYSYAVSGTLFDYVCGRRVDAIVDYSVMFVNPVGTTRGGHSDGRLRARVTPTVDFTDNDPKLRWSGTELSLYRFDRGGCPLDRAHQLVDLEALGAGELEKRDPADNPVPGVAPRREGRGVPPLPISR